MAVPDIKPVVSPKDVKPLPAPPDEWRDRARRGAVIFAQFCYVCHDKDGTGRIQRDNFPPIPNFTDPGWQKTKQDAELLVSILEGKGTLMPPNGDRISREEARDLVAFIRAFGPAPVVQGPAAQSEFQRSFLQLTKQWDELERAMQELRAKSGPND
jgi:mono/diheme cytochrome c family protein